ncbi:zinc ribbon domain-containing protein [Streptomyces lasalocidi]
MTTAAPSQGAGRPSSAPRPGPRSSSSSSPAATSRACPLGTHRPAVAVKYELSGILTCGFCKRGLVGHKSNEGKNHYYRCPATAHGGCGKTHIAAEPVEDAMATGMTAFLARLLQASEAAPAPAPEKIAAGSHRRCRAELTT